MGLWKQSFLSSYIIYLLLISKYNCQQSDDDGDGDGDDDSSSDTCSFISGQGCLNGMCKYCAMCIPSNCILGTPYSTGNNDGSTCAAIGDEEGGYDFYNYCLSTGDDGDDDDDDDDSDDAGCPTSTICYQYQYSNTTHAWDKLTCDQDSCLLISEDGSPPPVPFIDTVNGNITVSGPNTSHPISSKGSGHRNGTHYHYNELDIKSGSAASIALLTCCLILALCLVALLTRCFCRMNRVKRKLSKYVFFMNHNNNNNSRHGSIITLSPPPSYHSNIFLSSSTSASGSPQIMMLAASNASSELLPDYDQNLPPKYEHAIVAQIRGLTSTASSTTATGDETVNQPSSSTTSDNTVWIPVFVSPIPTLRPPNDTMNRSRSHHEYSWVSSHQDWATIQHEQ